MKTRPATGTRVRLTTAFLQSTGQYTGEEPFKRWTVVACDCGTCRLTTVTVVAVDERSFHDPARQRHINVHNLEYAHGHQQAGR